MANPSASFVFTETSPSTIPAVVTTVRSTYVSQLTRPISYRIRSLRKLYWAIEDNKEAIAAALKADLGKGFFASSIEEISWVQNDIIFMADNLAKWAKDEKPEDIAFPNSLVNPRIRKEPLGIVLVIGAFNFPIQLSLGPVLGAIAGGNTVVLKPSEGAPQCAMIMEKMIREALDPAAYTTIQGGKEQVQMLLEQKWDKIFFTGSPRTGTIVAKKAAETLTPIALELGGRNPAFITKKADVALAAKRLLWAKTMNAGQVCISHNYTLADKDVVDELVRELKAAIKQFFPKGTRDTTDFGRIANKPSFDRVKSMLDRTNGKIVAGGTMDESDFYIEPTVIIVHSPDDSLITEESFGPLMPILPVDDLDQAITIANQVHSTPLSLLAFGDKAETTKILNETRSGGASLNDGFFHAIIPTLAFGGVGDSGSGSYRGRASFDCFVHRRPVTRTPAWMEVMLALRYPPFDGTKKLRDFSLFGIKKPNFDREGNDTFSIVSLIMSLIGSKATWMVLAFAVGVRYFGLAERIGYQTS